MAPLRHPYTSLAFRWPCMKPASRTGRRKWIILAQNSVGSCMKSHTNWPWPWTLFVVMMWRAVQRNESCDSNNWVDSFVLFFPGFVFRAHVTTTKRRSRYGRFMYDWFVRCLPTREVWWIGWGVTYTLGPISTELWARFPPGTVGFQYSCDGLRVIYGVICRY